MRYGRKSEKRKFEIFHRIRVSWSISYAGLQRLMEEDNSTYYDSDIRSDIVDIKGDTNISIPDIRLGDEEQHGQPSSFARRRRQK